MSENKKRQELAAELEERQEIAEVAANDDINLPDQSDAEVPAVRPVEEDDENAPDVLTPEKDILGDKDAPVAKAGKRSAKAVREAEEEAARQAAKEAREQEGEEGPKRVVHEPNPRNKHGRKYLGSLEKVDRTKAYALDEALALAKETSTAKFDAAVELHLNLGVDPRQADQMVRSSVVLPHGTGKTIRVAVIAPENKHDDAKKAGADRVGGADIIADIEKGKLDFDMLVATPDQMATLGRVAKILGPRGLMPNPKSGTVTPDVAKAVSEAKAGKVEFRIDKGAIVHMAVGRVSFSDDKLRENAEALIGAVLKAKPSAAKGTYVKAIAVTTSMGPGIKLDAPATVAAISGRK